MKDVDKTREQLISELAELRRRIDELEKSEIELKQKDEALRESEERYRDLANTSVDGVISVDSEMRIILWNPGAERIFSYMKEEMQGQSLLKIVPKRYRIAKKKGFVEFRKNGSGPVIGKTLEFKGLRKDGTEIPIELSVSSRIVDETHIATAIVRDISERKQMQKQLMRAEKLDILGQLAAGISHELRNPLGAIKNAAFFLNMTLEEPMQEVKETLELLEKEVATSERIISSLLDFARAKPPIRRKVNIAKIIKEALSLANVPDTIKVSTKIESLPTILADPDQLAQVFRNIILNAVQAVPDGGRLVVKSEVPSPKWVAVSFADTGIGIPKDNLGRIFEPFFTTKAKGIGLGLAVTKSLVEGHGGTIEVKSKVGKGSTFTVRLPISRKQEK